VFIGCEFVEDWRGGVGMGVRQKKMERCCEKQQKQSFQYLKIWFPHPQRCIFNLKAWGGWR